MKRIMMLLVAAVTLTSAATAQLRVKMGDEAAIKKRIATSDAAIQDPKKSSKASTWLVRGDLFYEAGLGAAIGLYNGMMMSEIIMLYETPDKETEEKMKDKTYKKLSYPDFDAYIADDMRLHFWRLKKSIVDNAFDIAQDAYEKAYEIDPKQKKKIQTQLDQMLNVFKQNADLSFSMGDYPEAAKFYARTYDLTSRPIIDQPDTLSAFNAGYIYLVSKEYEPAIKYLKEAEKLGYTQDGDVYSYLYSAYMMKEQPEPQNAEQVLKDGILKNPENSKLIEALIMHYTSRGEDASQIIPMVEEAVKKDPNNHTFHFGLGLIYDELGDYDKAADSFTKALALAPDDFGTNYNLAALYIRKADAMLPEINEIPRNDVTRFDEKMAEFNAFYRQALPLLERAHELRPEQGSIIELLKSIYFRFRDESPEMMQSYEKYNEMFKALPNE